MISISECREKLGTLSDQLNNDEVEALRNKLYSLINQIVDNHFETTNGKTSSNCLRTGLNRQTS